MHDFAIVILLLYSVGGGIILTNLLSSTFLAKLLQKKYGKTHKRTSQRS